MKKEVMDGKWWKYLCPCLKNWVNRKSRRRKPLSELKWPWGIVRWPCQGILRVRTRPLSWSSWGSNNAQPDGTRTWCARKNLFVPNSLPSLCWGSAEKLKRKWQGENLEKVRAQPIEWSKVTSKMGCGDVARWDPPKTSNPRQTLRNENHWPVACGLNVFNPRKRLVW
jgi:hypothetical protein